jgi:hypothetical protein
METYKIWFDEQNLYLQTTKGKVFKHILSEFPLLEKASSLQRENYQFSPFGIHWPEIDEDLSFEGLTKRNSPTKSNHSSLSI